MTSCAWAGTEKSVQTRWPEDMSHLMPGVNDTWNLFQKFRKGKTVTGAEWKEARRALHEKYKKLVAEGGSRESTMEVSQRFNESVSMSTDVLL